MNSAYVWIATGGAIGSVARFWLNGVVTQRFGEAFPWGTMVVNVVGSFVIGALAALVMLDGMSSETRNFATQFLMTGICGGFTTFSTFSLQTLGLIRHREWLQAGGNILLSVVLCIVATWLGYLLLSTFVATKGN